MAIENRKSFLELNVIWKDDDMMELKVRASNTDFSGVTEVYDRAENLSNFASALTNYPKNNEILFYEAGSKDSYAYFSMKYYSIGTNGHLGIEVNLESNVSTEYRKEEKNKVKLEIITERTAIENFKKELLRLAKYEEGSATLYGNQSE